LFSGPTKRLHDRFNREKESLGMRITTLTAVAALAFAAAACNNNQAENSISADANLAGDPAVNDVLGANATNDNKASVALPTDAAGFATAVAASDLYEIQSGTMAMAKGASEEVRSIAQMLRREHEESSSRLKTAATGADIKLTPALDSEKLAMIDELKAASGAEFDRKYLAQQRAAHQKTLMLLQNYQQGGDNAAFKSFAEQAQKLVEGHADRINAIRK
jgi:putative membrane protein